MSIAAKYEMPGFPSRGLTWKTIVLIPVAVVGALLAIFALGKWLDPSRDTERAHLYGVAFSHPTIAAITGGTTNASFALIPRENRRLFSRVVPEDWKRIKDGDSVNGTARMFIMGKADGGVFAISYRYTPTSDSFVVVSIESLGQRLTDDGKDRP